MTKKITDDDGVIWKLNDKGERQYKILDPNFVHERVTPDEMEPSDRRMYHAMTLTASVFSAGIAFAVFTMVVS